MNYKRWTLIGITFFFVAIFSFNIYMWSQEFKDMFSYNEDYLSYIMVFVFVIALTGIFKWLLTTEIKLTKPKRRGKR